MKRMGNKGQGAMEYLMTYGWAILVVMIVGVVLWQLGIFKIGQTSTTTSGWTKLAPLSSSIVYRSSPETFSAQFNNLNGVPIRIRDAGATEKISGVSCNTTLYVDTTAKASLPASPVTTGAGDTFTLNCTCPLANKNPQDTYNMEITVVYDSVLGATSTEHTETGTIQGPAE
jgi:hypothetical protein